MSASALFGLSAYLFLLLILSALLKLMILGANYLHFYLSREARQERAFYEERFARLAAEAMEGPLLLTDQREPEEKKPMSCHLSDPFDRTYA